MAISRISILKFVELALTVTCIGLHLHSFAAQDINHQMVMATAFGGFAVVLVGVFVGIFAGQPIGKRVDIFFSVAGCALFLAAGALTIKVFEHSGKSETRDIGLAKGAMAIINGAAFLIDALLTFRGE